MELKDIYVITNMITNEQYVGQSKDANKRFSQHKASKDNLPIHQAMQTFGTENFSLKILEKQVPNFNEKEQEWIKKLNSIAPNGYNLTKGGEGYPHSSGVNCYQAKFTEQQLLEVINEIKKNEIPMTHIAKKYKVNKNIIYGINYGWHYKKDGENYPLRPYLSPKIKNKLPLNNPKFLLDIKKRLEYPQESTRSIAEDYGVHRQAIEHINQGKSYFNPNWDYPLRKIPYNPKIIRKDVVFSIINDLLYTTKSMRQISRDYSVNRSTVNHINLGDSKYYTFPKYTYPLRKFN